MPVYGIIRALISAVCEANLHYPFSSVNFVIYFSLTMLYRAHQQRSMSKKDRKKQELDDLDDLLGEFGINTDKTEEEEEKKGDDGDDAAAAAGD